MSSKGPYVVDFSSYSLLNKDKCVSTSIDSECLADELLQAFQHAGGVGLCYLKNHGLSQLKVDHVYELFARFFSLPPEIKRKYSRTIDLNGNGWLEASTEIFDSAKPVERKEGYLVWPSKAPSNSWPDEFVPGFTTNVNDLMRDLHELTYRVLDELSIALRLEDTHFLRRCHANLMENNGVFRCNWYPGIADTEVVEQDQDRMGEHSDFGTLTLLLQDTTGGLEYKTADGVWRAAPMIPGTVLVIVGDLLQRWSSDRLKAAVHRVVIPTEGGGRHRGRKSLVSFSQPPHEFEVRCLDGSDKYEPILVKDWTIARFDETTKLPAP